MEEVKNYNKPLTLDSLPPGYRFNPTDGEIIVDYLRKKVDHQPLPMDKIIEVNLYDHDPDQLAATYKPLGKDEWFFFTPRDRKYPNGQRPNRSVGGWDKDKDKEKDHEDQKVGYWKATGSDKQIIHEDQKVGYRKALVFYRGSARDGLKTNWIMHEFRVDHPPPKPLPRTSHNNNNNNNMRLDDCVLCRVYRKEERAYKRSQEGGGGIDESNQSSPKTPRFEFNPNEVDDNFTYGDAIMDSAEEREGNYQALQNQQPIIQMGHQPNVHQMAQKLNNVHQMGHQSIVRPNVHLKGQQPNVHQMGQRPNVHQMVQQPNLVHLMGHEPDVHQMGQQPNNVHQMGQQPNNVHLMAQQPNIVHLMGHKPDVHQMGHKSDVHQMGQQPNNVHQMAQQPNNVQQMGHQPNVHHMGQWPDVYQMDQQPNNVHQMGHEPNVHQMGQRPNNVHQMDQQPNNIHLMGQQPNSGHEMGQISSANGVSRSSEDNHQVVAPAGEYHVMQSTEFSIPDQTWDMYGYDFGFDFRFEPGRWR